MHVVCSLGAFSPDAQRQQMLCLELIVSTSTKGTATKFCAIDQKCTESTVLDFQSMWFIPYLSAVSERQRKKHLRCHYCIEGCEFEASK